MDHIAGDDRICAWPAETDRIVVDRMPRFGNKLHGVVELMRAGHDFLSLRGNDRQHGIGDPWGGRGILPFGFRPMRQLFVGEDLSGLREGR
ncbi:MAG TPA: hypothetical protein VHX39_10020, partial [Acetobacteraceae bacterium]|nr:hypothetical protein [Acetobacteraceae bacterium]